MDSLLKFQGLLKEIFQFESADLDFGIYRILNFKRELIDTFINENLKNRVEAIFSELQKDDLAKIDKEYAEAREHVIKFISADAITPSGGIKEEFQDIKVCKDYLKILQKKKDVYDLEDIKSQAFNDLFNFFYRYYSEGDFIPQYRYSIKGNRYAIPYNGEELKLYWANSDQYYIKTGELFRDYVFFASSTKEFKIIFRTVEAQEELGSNKATKQRFFILNKQPVEMLEKCTLVVRLNYRELTDEEIKKYNIGGGSLVSIQKKLNEASSGRVIKEVKETKLKGYLTSEYKNGCSLLLYHITRYAAKNTKDFFIHKNLKKFLSEQLDYFIKSEIFSLETIEMKNNIERHLARARAVRRIGEDIISFLAQIESFQKKLWEKKKFVLRTDYVITSNQIPKELHSEVLTNIGQKKEWKSLGIELPKSNKNLSDSFYPVDTRHFGQDFREKLLEKLSEKANLDDLLDGLLIKSENWQSLNLLEERYREQVDCIHIDPPYNTDSSGFLYRNNYRHSSWMTMMHNRIAKAVSFLSDGASFQCHIDEYEYDSLFSIFKAFKFPYQGTVIWDKRNPMMGGKGIAMQHEYIIWASHHTGQFIAQSKNIKKIVDKAVSIIRKNGGVCEKTREEFSVWIKEHKGLTGGERANKFIDDDGRVYQSVAMTWPNPNPPPPQFFIPIIHPKTNKPCPVPTRGWSRTPEKMKELIDKNEIIFGDNETTQPRRKIFLSDDSNRPISSVIQSGQKGKAELERLGLLFSYCHPVSLYEEIIYGGLLDSKEVVLDFFAGSGTTGHAVMALNREDNGNRKYLLVEMANYFDTVLVPRLKKICYSFNWKNGKPQDTKGISQFFKYQYLEQYEDTLDNIELVPAESARQLFQDDYLLKYFIDFETRGNTSLLKVENLKNPFSYRLRVNVEEVGEPEEMLIDIPETFNYLLGLKIKKLKFGKSGERKYMFILGAKGNRDIAVVWRKFEEGWNKKIFKQDKDFIIKNISLWRPHVVYVNGQSVLTPELGSSRVEVRYIESEFRKLMG